KTTAHQRERLPQQDAQTTIQHAFLPAAIRADATRLASRAIALVGLSRQTTVDYAPHPSAGQTISPACMTPNHKAARSRLPVCMVREQAALKGTGHATAAVLLGDQASARRGALSSHRG